MHYCFFASTNRVSCHRSIAVEQCIDMNISYRLNEIVAFKVYRHNVDCNEFLIIGVVQARSEKNLKVMQYAMN